MLREVLDDNVEANATPEHSPVRELREEFGCETEGTSFVGKTVNAYDHRTIETLAYPCPGSFLHPAV